MTEHRVSIMPSYKEIIKMLQHGHIKPEFADVLEPAAEVMDRIIAAQRNGQKEMVLDLSVENEVSFNEEVEA